MEVTAGTTDQRAIRGVLERIRERLIGPRPAPQCNALVLSGGGARASYQAGVLRFIADQYPDVSFPILTGVSAGAINAAAVANDETSFNAATSKLVHCWSNIRSDDVFEAPSSLSYLWRTLRGGPEENLGEIVPRNGIVDTAPLRQYLCRILNSPDGRLEGVAENLTRERLRALALITTNYATGQTVSWIQGHQTHGWERPNRVGLSEQLTVDHIMASTALPFLFPAIPLGPAWYGDGGIRLSEPLSPAIHLGADRIIAVSTRYDRTRREADMPSTYGYPPAAQIFGILLNAIFLDRIDQDAAILLRYNRLLDMIPRRDWGDMKKIRLVLVRPSRDLGRLSGEYQADLSGILNLFARGLGSRDTKSPDWLSMILFDPSYTERLIDIGYADAKARKDDFDRFFSDEEPD
ncbi:MAG: patatin-like phospholipase family protein [Rhodothermales bacterium]|nr:patatin-like phospholipase family protein [Rhodothermales bacterium]MBO6779691.1 patatin-like phospholipase family protein [Rhodothermales bacterium]